MAKFFRVSWRRIWMWSWERQAETGSALPLPPSTLTSRASVSRHPLLARVGPGQSVHFDMHGRNVIQRTPVYMLNF
jgi:hypothetical protein